MLENFEIPVKKVSNLGYVQKFKPIVIYNETNDETQSSTLRTFNKNNLLNMRRDYADRENRENYDDYSYNDIKSKEETKLNKIGSTTNNSCEVIIYNNEESKDNENLNINKDIDTENYELNKKATLTPEKLDFIDEFILHFPLPFYLTKEYVSKNFSDITNFSK